MDYRIMKRQKVSGYFFLVIENFWHPSQFNLKQCDLSSEAEADFILDQSWDVSALWNGESDGVEDKQSPQVWCYNFYLFFSWKKPKKAATIWHLVLFCSLNSCPQSFTFFLHLFSPFHFFLAHLICEWGGSIAAHLLSTALRLLISNYGCVFIVTAQSFSWKVAHFQQRVLSPSPHEVNSSQSCPFHTSRLPAHNCCYSVVVMLVIDSGSPLFCLSCSHQ